MNKKIMLIRTFKSVGIGGPIPPLELLYCASAIMNSFKEKYEVKILDTGIGNLSLGDVKACLDEFSPSFVCLNGLVWEAQLLHDIARICKEYNRTITVLAFGQLATLLKEALLKDENINFSIIGEADITIVEVLKTLEKKDSLSDVEGIAYRMDDKIVLTERRPYIEHLDDFALSDYAWGLINFKEYAKYPNWNGILKEKFYIPILTSRGCPFDCTFCCNREIFGKRFRARSAESVFSEIKILYERYNAKEIHIYDEVFNYDIERAKKICSLIIESGMDISLAFPHGLRADIMTDELIAFMKKAGTYKLNYGIETASPRLQRMMKKNLDIEKIRDVIAKTSWAGIIVGGYFMLGFPTETLDEMRQTIDFATRSELDLAYFFKTTCFYDMIDIYKSRSNPIDGDQRGLCLSLCYYSRMRSVQGLSSPELNKILLEAQQRFYLNFRRLWRGFVKSPRKTAFLKNLLNLTGIILQAYLLKQLTGKDLIRDA